MAELPGDVRVDTRLIVDHLRALADATTTSYPRRWTPQGTFDELLERADREPIHFHPALHHLHHNWDMGPARRNEGSGRSPKAVLRRLVARVINAALDRYFAEEQEYRTALARSIDAIAYRVDEIASADERALLTLVRNDLLDLARTLEARLDAAEAGGTR